MTAELTMPKLSDSAADVVILRWLKAPGESFERGEPLIEVETDKATVVYEAEAAGMLESILVGEGESAAVGQPIASVAGGGAQVSAEPRSNGAAAAGERPNATPVARKTAVELGVSLAGIAGTGPGGRITREDVQRAAAAGSPTRPTPAQDARGDVRVEELTATQKTIARRMEQSSEQIPSFSVTIDADVTELVALRRGAREESEQTPSLNDFVVKASALALRELPRFNASYVDGRVERYARVNVGVAVAVDDALLVPVVLDADRKTLSEVAAETRRLAEHARKRSLQPGDLNGGTFTVSNLGMFGVTSFTAIVDPPQTAILAVGAVRPVPADDGRGGVAFRDVMTLTLTCDHRVVYGADGARFLARVRDLLARPLVLAL